MMKFVIKKIKESTYKPPAEGFAAGWLPETAGRRWGEWEIA